MTIDGPGPGDDRDDSAAPPGRDASGVRAPWGRKDPAKADEVRHSAMVGFMSVPVHPRFPIRRSTLFMLVAFAGLATLLYFNPPQGDVAGTSTVIHTPQGDFIVPGATKVSPTTTSTTAPPAPTTTTTTTRASTSTTTTLGSSGTSTTTTTVAVPAAGGSGGTGSSTTTSTTTVQGLGTSSTSTTRAP